MRLLILEDEAPIAEVVAAYAGREGYDTSEPPTARRPCPYGPCSYGERRRAGLAVLDLMPLYVLLAALSGVIVPALVRHLSLSGFQEYRGRRIGTLDANACFPSSRLEREFVSRMALYALVGAAAMIVVACGLGYVIAGGLSRPVSTQRTFPMSSTVSTGRTQRAPVRQEDAE